MTDDGLPNTTAKRLLLGFFLAPLGTQALLFLSMVLNCAISPSARSCGTGIIVGGLGTSVFVFPAIWFCELVLGVPTALILGYFRILNARTFVAAGALASALVLLSSTIALYERSVWLGAWQLFYSMIFGGLTAAIMWFVGFRNPRKSVGAHRSTPGE